MYLSNVRLEDIYMEMIQCDQGQMMTPWLKIHRDLTRMMCSIRVTIGRGASKYDVVEEVNK